MVKHQDLSGWIGHTLIDQRGDQIGRITDLYADDATGEPEWLAVSTGRSGKEVSFVPLAGATKAGDDLRVPYPGDQVTSAPGADLDGELTQEEEARLYSHYGFDYSDERSPTGLPSTGEAGGRAGDRARAEATGGEVGTAGRDVGGPTAGRDVSGPTTDDAMTRSEERLQVGTERRERGRARLRKYVVTEEETRTVPVSREEVRIEREPITDDNIDRAMAGPEISDEEHEVVLHEERPVVSKETVPKERVRLTTEEVTEDSTVTEQVRKERIEGDTPDRPQDR